MNFTNNSRQFYLLECLGMSHVSCNMSQRDNRITNQKHRCLITHVKQQEKRSHYIPIFTCCTSLSVARVTNDALYLVTRYSDTCCYLWNGSYYKLVIQVMSN